MAASTRAAKPSRIACLDGKIGCNRESDTPAASAISARERSRQPRSRASSKAVSMMWRERSVAEAPVFLAPAFLVPAIFLAPAFFFDGFLALAAVFIAPSISAGGGDGKGA